MRSIINGVLATCGICLADEAFENSFPCLSHLSDSLDVG
jgi:hypothetical protein